MLAMAIVVSFASRQASGWGWRGARIDGPSHPSLWPALKVTDGPGGCDETCAHPSGTCNSDRIGVKKVHMRTMPVHRLSASLNISQFPPPDWIEKTDVPKHLSHKSPPPACDPHFASLHFGSGKSEPHVGSSARPDRQADQ